MKEMDEETDEKLTLGTLLASLSVVVGTRSFQVAGNGLAN